MLVKQIASQNTCLIINTFIRLDYMMILGVILLISIRSDVPLK